MTETHAPAPPPSDYSGATPAPTPAPKGSHIADPGPLGLAAFALTTFVLSMVNANIIPQALVPAALGLALAYGGIVQVIAGVWEFAKGNTFGALAFCSYGAFWISFWWLAEHDLEGMGPEGYKGVGVYLLGWTIFTAYMLIASSRVNAALLAVFVVLTVTFLLLTIGWFDHESAGWIKWGGYFGILTALLAWYTSFAGVTKFTFGRDVLPVGAR